jgi:hypothetical protein
MIYDIIAYLFNSIIIIPFAMIRITQAQQIFALLRMQSASMALLRFPLPDLGEKIK